MRFRTAIPHVSQKTLDALDACGVKTVEAFLFNTTPEDVVRQAPANMATYEDLLTFREQLIEMLAADGLSGDHWVEQKHLHEDAEHPQSLGWTTGMTELDKLFGHTRDNIVEISGGKGSGKTVG